MCHNRRSYIQIMHSPKKNKKFFQKNYYRKLFRYSPFIIAVQMNKKILAEMQGREIAVRHVIKYSAVGPPRYKKKTRR